MGLCEGNVIVPSGVACPMGRGALVVTGRSLQAFLGIQQLSRAQMLKKARAAPSKKPFVRDCRTSIRAATVLVLSGEQFVASLAEIASSDYFIRKTRADDSPLGGLRLVVLDSNNEAAKALSGAASPCMDRLDVRVVSA